jgi:hypothetical protein
MTGCWRRTGSASTCGHAGNWWCLGAPGCPSTGCVRAPGIAELLAGIGLPAFATDKYLEVLATNPLATALSPNIRVGENRLRAIFLDPAEQALHPDWKRTGPLFVAAFRKRLGNEVDDRVPYS